jgi:transketolase
VPALSVVPKAELDALRDADVSADDRLELLADACRLNALVAVKRAGSGHLGSTFSAMDIVAFLLFEELNTADVGWESPDRDVYFSSKGHDVPGLYAALYGLGVISQERFARLRRLDGLDGHPDVRVPGIEANSGSLGMGVSKGRGIAWAKRHLGRGGRVVVMLGDGELQEGQNYEGLQAAAHERLAGLTVVVDRNELQSDKRTAEIVSVGGLEERFMAFGWHAVTCDGHSFAELRSTFASLQEVRDRPQAVVARTIKGKGVSFMEHPEALRTGGGTYRWHAGAPDDESFDRAFAEIAGRLEGRLAELGLGALRLEPLDSAAETDAGSLEGEPESGAGTRVPRVTDEYVVEAYGDELVRLGAEREDLVVLDADLASDCRVRAFEVAYPDRFVECGIAEQDMVSTAGGLARHGLLPVVNSFASFLAARANEQIYNQASERTKVVYALHYAGLIPAGPGKSHQSVRDISLLGALPELAIVQPATSEETRELLRWAVEAEESVALRLAIGPSPRRIELEGALAVGRGRFVRRGADAVLLAYGPVMLHEALLAAERLVESGIDIGVVNLPWLNRFDSSWLAELPESVFVLEDHAPVGALGDALRRELGRDVTVFGVEGWPACGTPAEALRAHALDGGSLSSRIERVLAS